MFAILAAGYLAGTRSRDVVRVVAWVGAVQPPPVCDDEWNTEHRAEAPLQRADRNFAELLQELRVAQTGVQILFAFLLTLSFMDRFAMADAFQRGVYVFTLAASAVTVALLIAPVAVHRLLFQRGRKRELVRVGHRLVVTGLSAWLSRCWPACSWRSTSSSAGLRRLGRRRARPRLRRAVGGGAAAAAPMSASPTPDSEYRTGRRIRREEPGPG